MLLIIFSIWTFITNTLRRLRGSSEDVHTTPDVLHWSLNSPGGPRVEPDHVRQTDAAPATCEVWVHLYSHLYCKSTDGVGAADDVLKEHYVVLWKKFKLIRTHFYNINEVVKQTQKYGWIKRQVAGSATYKQSKTVWSCPLRSVCFFSHENKEMFEISQWGSLSAH